MSLPPVAPHVLADAVGALPGRLRKRLDETVEQARSWPVEPDGDGVVVTVDDQRVRLAARVLTADDAVCGCLLAPRCLHRTALLAAAPVLAPDSVLVESTAPADFAGRADSAARADSASLQDLANGNAPSHQVSQTWERGEGRTAWQE